MTLSCSDIKEDISSILDGELDEHKQTSMAEHLAACGECKQDHDTYKSLGKELQRVNSGFQESAPDIWTALSLKLPSVCECIQEDLSAYLDGELIPVAKEGVATHLEKCAECLTKFNQLSNVNSLLSKGLVLPERIEVDIWSQVKARLNDDCVLIRSELSPFIDKEVATLRHRSITAHLTECVDCTDHFNELSQTGDVIRSNYLPEIPADFDLWPQIQSKMNVIPMASKQDSQQQRPAQNKPRKLFLYRAAAAVVVSGIAASSILFMYTQNPATPQVAPVTAEAYLVDQSLGEPADVAEAVYEHQP